MKIKYSSIVGIFVALVLIASLVLPVSVATPASAGSAESRMQWWPVDTPDLAQQVTASLYSPKTAAGCGDEQGSEITKLLIGVNGTSMYAMYTINVSDTTTKSKAKFMSSPNGGRTWNGSAYNSLMRDFTLSAPPIQDVIIWDMAIAPDNANVLMAAVSSLAAPLAYQVFVSNDGGSNWENTQWPPTGIGGARGPSANDYISALDISMDYGGRDMLVGTRNGTGTAANTFWTMKMPGYGGWNVQNLVGTPASTTPWTGDVIAAKFSPTYNGDSTIAVLYSQPQAGTKPGTWLVTGVHDIAKNLTAWQGYNYHVEIKNTGSASTATIPASPAVDEIITGMIQMPSDFSGQSASLRRIYVSTDSTRAAWRADTFMYPNRGVFRVDDTTVYTLMDTTSTFALGPGVGTGGGSTAANRRVASIAYWGTYASGKLLVGERLGAACTASVPVWFTDSPTVCPVPCWYPAKKPPTGAAGFSECINTWTGYGNAYVVWSPTFAGQGVAYAVTSASSYDGPYLAYAGSTPAIVQTASINWPAAIFNVVRYDESAFSLTRNNGETWNQLSLIDTKMDKLTDVAPSADCTTIYLASVNNGVKCQGFDSVWRSSTNEKVVAPPLPALPIGQVWERVRTSPTAKSCNVTQTNYAILRLAPDKLDGQIVGWAAGGVSNLSYIGAYPVGIGGNSGRNSKAMAWSPDFGDYWADVNPRVFVQDFAFESATVLYVMQFDSAVQKMPYTGTAWASTTLSVDTKGGNGHTIEALAPDKVLTAQAALGPNTNVVSYSPDGGLNFIPMGIPPSTPANVGYHAIFDTDFTKNATVYLASDGGFSGYTAAGTGGGKPTDTSVSGAADTAPPNGLVFRNKVPAGSNSTWTDMLTGAHFIGYCGPHMGYYGLAQSNSKNVTGQGTLYAAHTIQSHATGDTIKSTPAAVTDRDLMWSGVERTLSPLDGIPKPGLDWSCMDASANMFQPRHPIFTLEPKSLKICGCLTQDTDTTLYAIDNDMYSNNHNVAACRPDRWSSYTGVTGSGMAIKTTGLLWEYTDCVAKKGPKLILDDGAIIGCDPASGRNQEVNFRWEQLCIATIYQLQIAKDKAFTLGVFDTGNPYGCYSAGGSVTTTVGAVATAVTTVGGGGMGVMPMDVTAPAFVMFSAGGGGMPNTATYLVTQGNGPAFSTPELECGHGYFWRVRVLDETTRDAINSPWSDARSFTIKAGFRVTTPYYGPQLLAPDNGCGCSCSAPIAFSWSPFKETIEYQFVLSENADLSSPLVNTAVKTTAYQFTGTAKCNKTYFWRVMANKPAPSEWSAVFSFNTQPEPAKAPPPPPDPGTPMWVWVIIAIGAILVIVTLVLIFKTRRV